VLGGAPAAGGCRKDLSNSCFFKASLDFADAGRELPNFQRAALYFVLRLTGFASIRRKDNMCTLSANQHILFTILSFHGS